MPTSTPRTTILLAALLTGALPALPQGPDPAFDDFERQSLGPSWTRYGGSGAAIVNHSDLGVPNASWCFAGWTASAFASNQFSETVISPDIDPNMLTQVYVRRRTSDLARYGFHYNADPGQAQWEIKYDGVPTAQTRILARATAPPPAPGDAIRIECDGAGPVTIRGFHAGRLVLTASDTAPQRITAAGTAGVVARMRQGAPYRPPMPIFESWTGGTLYWIDLGRGLAGSNGAPALAGAGALRAGSTVTLRATRGLPGAPAGLALGRTALNQPFAGGVLVPSPEVVAPLVLGAAGEAALTFAWPSGTPSGIGMYAQLWVLDPGGPARLAASNALLGLVP